MSILRDGQPDSTRNWLNTKNDKKRHSRAPLLDHGIRSAKYRAITLPTSTDALFPRLVFGKQKKGEACASPFSQPNRYCNGIIAAGQSTAAAGVAPVTFFRITPEASVQKLFWPVVPILIGQAVTW